MGVAVGVGPMHCLLPHCGGPHLHHHLSAPHPQNPQPGHNHHVHPAHQPPPSPSPHLNHQLSHHQLTVNINHLSHQQQQQQQTQHQQAPPQYRVVTANASKYKNNQLRVGEGENDVEDCIDGFTNIFRNLFKIKIRPLYKIMGLIERCTLFYNDVKN